MNIILGDCSEELKKFEDKSFDHSFTSPPYNRKRNDKYSHYTDARADWGQWQKEIIENLLRVSRNYVFYNIQTNYYNRSEVYKLIGTFSESIKEIIVWEKTNPMPASGNSITNSLEYFIVLGDKPLKSNTTYTKNIISTSVNSQMPKNHKAVMKQEVADWFIERFTQEGEHILDPFMGTGTTGVACRKYQRDFTGIEISKEYYELALERIIEA